MRAASGYPPEVALALSVDASVLCWVVIHDGQIEGAFGVSEEWGVGVPWFLATDKFYEFGFAFAKESRKVVYEHMLNAFPMLVNFVDSRHKESMRWLEWLGFTIHKDQPTYLHDSEVIFYPFSLRRPEEPDV